MKKLINIKIPGTISYCDFCTDEKKAVEAVYDAKTRMGFWAHLCEKHFQQFGIGLGLGKGQRLIEKRKKFIRKPQDPFVARIIMSFVTGEFYCKICKKHFQSRSGIVGHIKNFHGSEVRAKVNSVFSSLSQ